MPNTPVTFSQLFLKFIFELKNQKAIAKVLLQQDYNNVTLETHTRLTSPELV